MWRAAHTQYSDSNAVGKGAQRTCVEQKRQKRNIIKYSTRNLVPALAVNAVLALALAYR